VPSPAAPALPKRSPAAGEGAPKAWTLREDICCRRKGRCCCRDPATAVISKEIASTKL